MNTNLVTTYSFRGKEYLVNMNSLKHHTGNIEIKVTDKKTSEQWLGTYDASYIENLTQKTGNFKRYDTFISMLKSGLLSTSQCVTLDLLTFEDLEMLRSKISHSRGSSSSHILAPTSSNRRYLIVTYTVEFDRIHYPLALEYLGPPDPRILQETILRLEKQVVDLQHRLSNGNWEDIANQIESLQRKVVDITTENILLKEQLGLAKLKVGQRSWKQSHKEIETLMKSIYNLENRLKSEHENVTKLQNENYQLSFQLEHSLKNEKLLRAQLNALHFEPNLNEKNRRFFKKIHSPSSKINRSLDNPTEKPFTRNKSGERKVRSARNSLELARSSSEDSFVGGSLGGKPTKIFQYRLSPRARVSSPSFSDLSHNSGISRCACRTCLETKYTKKDLAHEIKKREKGGGRAILMKRIQSLENLINGIALK